MAVYILADTCI